MTAQVVTQAFNETMPLADLTEHPANPRRGDDGAVGESIAVNGFYGNVIVQASTGYVLAGNTRFRAMRAAGAETIPAMVVDCDDDTARRILLADNRTSDLAFYDESALLELLTEARDIDSLLGTGYDAAAYELLLQSVNAENVLGGVRQGLTPADRRDAYEDSAIRSIILPFGPADYEAVTDGLASLRALWGMETNAEVVLRLVANAG